MQPGSVAYCEGVPKQLATVKYILSTRHLRTSATFDFKLLPNHVGLTHHVASNHVTAENS